MHSESATAHVALLRGINVGGKNILPMKDLASFFTEAGCTNVQTYIQSGNVLFRAPHAVVAGLAAAVTERIQQRFGYRVPVILRTAEQMAATLQNNPFLAAGAPEKELHVYFLAGSPAGHAIAALGPRKSPPDSFQVVEREIYLHLPNGMGRTKLTNAYFDTKLATISTARNWQTVQKLAALLNAS